MNPVKLILASYLAVLALAFPVVSQAGVNIVAAENFYGDIAKQIGGAHVEVVSILSNPDEDPHLFEASPSVARAMSAAKIVIASGYSADAAGNGELPADVSFLPKPYNDSQLKRVFDDSAG